MLSWIENFNIIIEEKIKVVLHEENPVVYINKLLKETTTHTENSVCCS